LSLLLISQQKIEPMGAITRIGKTLQAPFGKTKTTFKLVRKFHNTGDNMISEGVFNLP
jgi:hypothetical protein